MERVWNRWRTILAGAILGALTLATYWPVIRHEFIGYDDPVYVTENPRVQAGLTWNNALWAFGTSEGSNWHPLTWLSHMLDVQLFGLHPAGHHFTNLLLHVANTVLLFLLLKRMTNRFWPSAFVAGLFALHPLHIESVAWVAERKDVLSTFFFLLTLAAYIRYARLSVASPRILRFPFSILHPPSSFFYFLALFTFALGLLSKPMLVTVPFLLLVLDFWPLNRLPLSNTGDKQSAATPRSKPLIPSIRRLVWEKLPFLALAAVSSLVTFLVQRQGGAVSSFADVPLPGRVANAVAAYLKYLGKAFWPADLSVFYPHPALDPAGRWSAWQITAAALALVLISVLALLRLKREPWFATGWFWYLGTLVPVIGLAQAGNQAMADRYTYIPLIGIFLIVAWALEAIPRSALGRWSATVFVLAACVFLTRQQLRYWQNDFTLFEHALTSNERNAPAHSILGTAYGRQSKYGLALVYCRAATQADASYPGGWHALGDVYDSLGKPQQAIRSYETALHWNPALVQTWFRLGCVHATAGNFTEAVKCYQTALGLNPDFGPAHNNLGAAQWARGYRKEALKEFAEAVRLAPGASDKRFNFGTALAEEGRLADAATQLAQAVRLKPDYFEARAALGGVSAALGQFTNAEEQFRAIIRLAPTNAEAHLKLGGALLMSGKTNEASAAFAEVTRLKSNLANEAMTEAKSQMAAGQYDAALRSFTTVTWVQPGNAEAHERLGLLLAQRGKLEEATFHLREALGLAPGAEAHYNLALILAMQTRLKDAIIQYRQVLELKSDSAPALNDLAWILATAPSAELRNGPEAVHFAERACQLTGHKNPRFLGTLDAAYAEAGQFEDAIKTAGKTRDVALAAGEQSVAQAAETRLSHYRAGQAFRQ